MKKPSILLAVVIASATFAFGEAVEPTTGYVPLANTVRKLKSDKALKVAVIGDSIAYGQMATEVSMQGYPYSTRVTTNSGGMPTGNPMSFARITTDYVKYLAKRDYNVDDVNINTFYSVWGGATAKSSFGYVSDDIIARQPDLVFYEIWNDNDETLRYAENTLRVLWKTLPNTDVVLISVGGAFSKSSVYQPLVTKYGIKWINAYSNVQDWFGQFGVVDSNVYGVVDADGKVSGTRGYLFGNSSPHVNEEGYVWFCDNIVKNLKAFFAAAADKSGALETVAPAGSVDGDPIAATGPEMYHAEIITPASPTPASGSWTLIAREVADEPRDTYDRVKGDAGDRIKAAAADATLTRSVTGNLLLFRGSENMQYKIGEGEFAAVTDELIVNLGDDEVTAELTLKATAKDAYINEFYVYGRDYQAITPKATKHRYSVKFYAKIAPEYYHDWHLGGVQVIPHPISWVNCYRMETYGAALTLPGENIISSQCEKNGAFLGWVEAEGVEWNGSEVIPIVTTHEGKTIYAAGATIDPATLGRDVTLVAAYANGPVAKTEADVRKVTFVTENSANMRLLQFSPVYESAMSVTMPDLIPPVAGSTADGWKVINTDTVYPVGAAVPITTDTEFVPVYTKTVVINDELLADCWTFDGTYMTDGTGWKLKASVVGEQLQITAVSAQPADTSVKLDLGRFAVNSAHDTIYYGYLIESNVFKSKTMTCAVDLGLVTKIAQGAFGNTGIVDVRFGPYLVEINSGWANGAFKDCASLTNVVFAQGASATVTPGEAFTFENCTALRSLDCSGIGYFKTRGSNYSQVGGCTALTNVVIRAPSKLDRDFFCSVSSVTYHFYGAAPELTSGALNLGSSSTTYVHLDTNAVDYAAQLASWNALTESGTINGKDSTWKTSVVSGGRPLLLYGVTQPEEDPPEEDPPEDPPEEDPPVVGGRWVLNAAGTEMTDGTWTFKVTASGSSYTVGECTGYPETVSELDFTQPLVDQTGTAKQFKEFVGCFGTGKNSFRSPACERVGDLKLAPKNIGNNAFGGCVNMRLVGGFPAEITSVGMHAFQRSGLSGDLDLTHLTSFQRAAFMQTAITSVRLGPGITTFAGAYDAGVFQGCTSLTNVVCDPSGGITISEGEGWTFNGCTALQFVDLSGVSVLRCDNTDDRALFKGCSALKTVIISNCTSMTTHVFSGAGAADYHFYGAVPSIPSGTKLGAVGGTTYVHLDQGSRSYNAMLLGWGELTEGGVLNETNSTWNSEVVNDGTRRPLLLVKYGTAPEVDPDDPQEDELDGSYWLYDSANGTVSDSFWTFLASDDGAGNIVFNAHTGVYPDVAGDLDFSKPVKDAANNSYTIVKLNPGFNNDTAGRRIARLVFPAEGVTEIGDNAFNQCTAITNIVNFLPDSVTKVGKYAFYKCPVKQTLYVKGVPRFGTGVGGNNNFSAYAFNSSSITRIVFGPDLKEIFDWDSGPFSYCTALTNITFDAAMTGAKFSGCRNGGFYGCTALTGTVDLSGFSDLTYIGTLGGNGRVLSGTAVTKVILGAGLEKLHVNFFDQMGSLKEVVFNNAPGAGGFAFLTADANNRANGLMFGGISDAQAVIARIRAEDVEAWRPYAQNGEITAIDSTFSESFAGPNYTRRYLVIDGDDEPIGPLGEWIYDDAAGVVSNRLWAFEAEGVLTSLQRVGRCLRYPDTPSVLDFTASITDMRGLPMTILSLDTQFSTAADNAAMSDAGAKVADLRLPGGLVSIKNAAFARLDNCTNVVNFLPDTVTAVGKYAFYKFPVKADLRIRGLVNMGTSNPDAYVYQFGSSKITSVTFGPGFKSLFSWSKSPFNGCTFLTNVTFDAATTDAWFGGIRDDGFYNCTALTGTVDLSGFSNLSYVSDDGGDNNIFSGTKVEHFIVGERCTKLGAGFFSGVSTLKDVTFMGPPPTIETGVNVSGGWLARKASRFFDSNNQSVIKITTCIYKAHRAEWLPYTTATSVDELKRKCNITWKPEYVAEGVDLSLRPFSVVDDSSGMIIICK